MEYRRQSCIGICSVIMTVAFGPSVGRWSLLVIECPEYASLFHRAAWFHGLFFVLSFIVVRHNLGNIRKQSPVGSGSLFRPRNILESSLALGDPSQTSNKRTHSNHGQVMVLILIEGAQGTQSCEICQPSTTRNTKHSRTRAPAPTIRSPTTILGVSKC